MKSLFIFLFTTICSATSIAAPFEYVTVGHAMLTYRDSWFHPPSHGYIHYKAGCIGTAADADELVVRTKEIISAMTSQAPSRLPIQPERGRYSRRISNGYEVPTVNYRRDLRPGMSTTEFKERFLPEQGDYKYELEEGNDDADIYCVGAIKGKRY